MTTAIKGYFNARKDGDTHAKSMFSGVEGNVSDTIIPDLPTFLQAAGRDYGILRTPALVRDPFGGLDEHGDICEAVREVEGQFHLTRTNDGRVVSPHTVTGQYAPLTLLDIAAEIQPWCDAGWVTPDAVFSGRNESLEILCLRMDAGGTLPNGETWEHYIAFRNPHGAGGKAKGTISSFRVVCSNAFNSVGRGIEFVVGHRISATMTMEERQEAMTTRARNAVAAWQTAEQYIADISERINAWSGKAVSFTQAETLTDSLLGIRKLDDASARKKNMREAVLAAFSMPQFGTNGANLYDWMNAVTFVNSSPHAGIVQSSKVSAVDRTIRNVDPHGSGYIFEAKAEKLATEFLAA